MDAAAMEFARLVLRQEGAEADAPVACDPGNAYDGRMGVRISSIFVIFVGSLWGKSLFVLVHYVFCPLLLDISFIPDGVDLLDMSRNLAIFICYLLTSKRRCVPYICQTFKD